VSRALLLDYGGVLCGPHGDAERAEVERILGAGGDAFEEAYWEHRPAYDLGEVRAPEYWRRVAETLGVPAPDGDLTHLLAVDAAGWGHLLPDAVAWAAEIAERVPTWLLSNMPHEVKEPLLPLIAGAVPFRDLYFSCDLGVVKPYPRAYTMAVLRMGVPAEDVVMVDDREVNIEGALAAGLRAVLFTTPAESIPAIERALAG
jgi:putative hydrolase of the HAD superfamily